MNRNRKKNSNTLKALPILKGVFACLILGGLFFSYLVQKNRLMSLGTDLKKIETQIETTRRQNDYLVSQIYYLKSPRLVASKCQQWQLGLVVPGESQFIRVKEGVLAKNNTVTTLRNMR
ncbi:MAG: hypothetical protein SGI71_11650 [Verrucomicrobiota bacterium]|nr:hypothetical protein [Verrucomicrobiota bacterium]